MSQIKNDGSYGPAIEGGYIPNGHGSSKYEFYKDCKAVLKAVGQALATYGLKIQIKVCEGGPAVSGEVIGYFESDTGRLAITFAALHGFDLGPNQRRDGICCVVRWDTLRQPGRSERRGKTGHSYCLGNNLWLDPGHLLVDEIVERVRPIVIRQTAEKVAFRQVMEVPA